MTFINNPPSATSRFLQTFGVNKMAEDSINSINGIAETSTTSLISAFVSNKDVSYIELLLKNNADVNICNKYRQTPLHLSERLEVTKLLIKFGADLNSTDLQGNTPLMISIINNRDYYLILDLIKSGTRLDIRNQLGQSALHLALDKKLDKILVEAICDRYDDFNTRDVYGYTPLCYALRSGCLINKSYHLNFIKKLIHKGFSVQKFVIFRAVLYNQNINFIKEIIKYHDIRSVTGRNNYSVLHVVGDSRLIGIFIRKGVKINHKCTAGETPLLFHLTVAFSVTSIDVIESLLFWGADVHDLDKIFNKGDKMNGELSEIKFCDSIYDLLILYGFSVDINNSITRLLLKYILQFNYELRKKKMNYGLLRHILISNQNVFIQNDLLNSSEIIRLCQSVYHPELEKMERKNIAPNLSYRKFCLKEFRSIKRNYFPEFTENDHWYIKSSFPYFFNEIIIKIRIHINNHKRNKLKKYLLGIRLITKNCIEKDDENLGIELDHDSMSMVGYYLNDREISSLIAAAIM